MPSDPPTVRACEHHGRVTYLDERCVLCARDEGTETAEMRIAIGIEDAVRGEFDSREAFVDAVIDRADGD